ncbi:MAG: YhbY family RNA-binding protein [Deltaproteobacteria bacterium]|nr:YhbY family RNA-binding protein [Deltaproteobacteria bacterium]
METKTNKLQGFQRKYLRGIAHDMKPVVFIGKKGLTEGLDRSINDALTAHELIKVKYIDFKDKENKTEISGIIEETHDCQMVGMIGHTAIFYRQHPDEEKRKIAVPSS